MSHERWRPVVGWEGWYEISDHGRLRRIKFGQGVKRLGKPLSPGNNQGYHGYCLYGGNRKTQVQAHRLVAAAFIGPCPPGHEINHKNFDRADNRVENLEYVTRADNLRYTRENRDIQYVRGEASPSAKLTEEEVRTIRLLYPRWTYKRIAERFGMGTTIIENIVYRKKWKHVTDNGPVIESILREAEEGV